MFFDLTETEKVIGVTVIIVAVIFYWLWFMGFIGKK